MRRVTGFDRVMVYRFDEEWNGEVVAEDARADLDPYLGLHYPASTSRPRRVRCTPRSGCAPSPTRRTRRARCVPALDPRTGLPLDLSGAALRSVSPVHLQYLANMGVRASMSVSLLVHGRLWGLVACHH